MAASLVMKPLDPNRPPSPPTHTHTNHKVNPYSKLIAITTTHTNVPCLMMQIVLSVFYMHNFTSLIIILLTDTRFHKRKFQKVFHESYKICIFDIYKIDVKCRKSNNKHPCEFVLTPGRKTPPCNSLKAP